MVHPSVRLSVITTGRRACVCFSAPSCICYLLLYLRPSVCLKITPALTRARPFHSSRYDPSVNPFVSYSPMSGVLPYPRSHCITTYALPVRISVTNPGLACLHTPVHTIMQRTRHPPVLSLFTAPDSAPLRLHYDDINVPSFRWCVLT